MVTYNRIVKKKDGYVFELTVAQLDILKAYAEYGDRQMAAKKMNLKKGYVDSQMKIIKGTFFADTDSLALERAVKFGFLDEG